MSKVFKITTFSEMKFTGIKERADIQICCWKIKGTLEKVQGKNREEF